MTHRNARPTWQNAPMMRCGTLPAFAVLANNLLAADTRAVRDALLNGATLPVARGSLALPCRVRVYAGAYPPDRMDARRSTAHIGSQTLLSEPHRGFHKLGWDDV